MQHQRHLWIAVINHVLTSQHYIAKGHRFSSKIQTISRSLNHLFIRGLVDQAVKNQNPSSRSGESELSKLGSRLKSFENSSDISTFSNRKRKSCTTYARDKVLPLRLCVTALHNLLAIALEKAMEMDVNGQWKWVSCCVQCNGDGCLLKVHPPLHKI